MENKSVGCVTFIAAGISCEEEYACATLKSLYCSFSGVSLLLKTPPSILQSPRHRTLMKFISSMFS